MRTILPSYMMQSTVIIFIVCESQASFAPITLVIMPRVVFKSPRTLVVVCKSYDDKSALALFLALPSAARL